MLGSTPICAVLGSGVDNTDHQAVQSFINAAADLGLALLFIQPGTKAPFDGRTPAKRLADDKAYQEAAQIAGRRDWAKVKSPSGLALATSDKKTLKSYLTRYIKAFGPDCAINLAVEVGKSRIIVVDCDTDDQKNRFLEVAEAPEGTAPTVISPGTRADDGTWAHEPGNGHYWFTLPDTVTLPTNIGSMTWGGDDGFAVLWDRRYVLIPPSTRAEGSYEQLGSDYEAPSWLIEKIVEKAAVRTERSTSTPSDTGDAEEMASAIDEWAEKVSWASILEPLEWTVTARPDACGCEVWTAPGNHSSPKSATAHDSGCSLGRYTETNAPLHIWTDHDLGPLQQYIDDTGAKTLSKLQAVAYTEYSGNVGKAMDTLGVGPAPTEIERESGVNTRTNMTADAGHDAAADFDLPSTRITDEDGHSPFDTVGDSDHDPDIFDAPGLPIIAPFSHWRDLPPPEYVIEGLIEHGGLSAIIGPPGVGKSSVALDMACHIATGKPWQGRKVLKTRVLYLPGEGLSGANQRLKSWVYEHDIPDPVLDDGIRVGNSIVQLGAHSDSWALLTEYIIRQRIGLIIFDTFARMALGIEENSATEVGKAVKRFDKLRELTNAGVLVVHHTAKNNPSMARGSSALNGALDSELLVSEAAWDFDELGLVQSGGRVPSGKPIQLATTKQKNAEQLDHPIPLLLRNCSAYDAPYVTSPSGTTDPMLGEIILARPVEEPSLETAVRLADYTESLPEQGATRSDMVAAVRPDPYTSSRRDAAKAWRQKVHAAVDLGLRVGLLETASGQRLGARYVRGPVGVEQARVSYAAEVIGDEGVR